MGVKALKRSGVGGKARIRPELRHQHFVAVVAIAKPGCDQELPVENPMPC
jgi:hypothetical protein